ncbi:MAG: GNAT family N-acetyltransferase [Pleurocapsa sp. MO_226.B13]|nr:GNAT family N-acetyltransferase [Pleurocapsa sp. MO_226.B13]
MVKIKLYYQFEVVITPIDKAIAAMNINTETITAKGIKFSLVENNQEIARAYLYLMHNELHHEPFGLLEDVYVAESQRGKGLGTKLVQQVMQAAR